jgi:hypothetical protein
MKNLIWKWKVWRTRMVARRLYKLSGKIIPKVLVEDDRSREDVLFAKSRLTGIAAMVEGKKVTRKRGSNTVSIAEEVKDAFFI